MVANAPSSGSVANVVPRITANAVIGQGDDVGNGDRRGRRNVGEKWKPGKLCALGYRPALRIF